eukprot:6616161-Pyramimonas_sp.AAC.1
MAWHSGIHLRGSPPSHAPWAQGGLPHRCRENAILCVQAAQWRAAQGGVSTITTKYDGTNAFAATS